MRLFVAIEIPAAERGEAGRRQRAVREELPPARWVDPDALHLTLVFLGSLEEPALPALGAAFSAAAAAHPSFSLALAGGGTFPPRRPARVAWIGVEAGPELAALQADVAAAAATAVGYEPEGRPYNPHLTLARCPEPWPRPAIDTFTAAFAGPIGAPFPVSRIALFESRPSAGGSRYRVAAAFPLAARAGRAGRAESAEAPA